MATRERPADRGRSAARAAVLRLGAEGRAARMAAGLSSRFVGAAISVSHTHVCRFERGQVASPRLDVVGAYFAVLGMELSLRAYPAGDPLRDRGQRALLARFRAEMPPMLAWREEVVFPNRGDLRAWDAEVRPKEDGWRVRIEAESRITDGQALERRLRRKIRDGGDGHVVLLVSDTRNNREALGLVGPGMGELLPLQTRAVLAALRAGRDPGGNGIVIL
jgi:transcriptional regulator with XRE-family HTH domain